MCQSLYAKVFFFLVDGLKLTTLLKKRFWHMRISVTFAKLLKAPENMRERLWLKIGSFLSFTGLRRLK